MGRENRELAVLAYGDVYDAAAQWDAGRPVTTENLHEHLSYLQDNEWTVIDAEALLLGLKQPQTLPERAALLTFDAARQSFCEQPLQLLRQFNYPAVLFIATQFVGRECRAGGTAQKMCDWHDLRMLQEQGVSVQSQGVSQRAFAHLTLVEQQHELVDSKGVLEMHLEQPVEMFALPHMACEGDGLAMRRMLRRIGYRAAFVDDDGVNRFPIFDAFRLSRMAMCDQTDLDQELSRPATVHTPPAKVDEIASID